MKDKPRRCIKCGKSTTQYPSLTLYRFPRPGSWNNRRIETWARFVYPDEAWSSYDFQKKLYSNHKMLCENHFENSSFIDYSARKLHRYAVPNEDVDESPPVSTHITIVSMNQKQEHQAGPIEVSFPQTIDRPAEILNDNTAHDMLLLLHEPRPFVSITSINQEPKYEADSLEDSFAEAIDGSAEILIDNTAHEPQSSAKSKRKRSTKREANLYNKCRQQLRQICKLKKQIRTKTKTDVLKYLASDKAVEELSNIITYPFAVLLQGQLSNCKKRSKGRKWNLHQKLIALQLFKRSPSCYSLLRRQFCLPCQTTLQNLQNLLPLRNGINNHIFDVLSKNTARELQQNNECILLFDVISIRKSKTNVNHNSRIDYNDGFQDHGTNGHALVFMIVGIQKQFKQPVAYYLSGDSFTADIIAVLIKEVLGSCFLAGVNIAATVCDTDGVNRRALNILGTSLDHPYFEYNHHEIVALFDAPHMLKCFRNLFIKYNVKFPPGVTPDGQATDGLAKWSHISNFFEEDHNNPVFVFAPSLTKAHISPNNRQKMVFKLAAQVFSHTVACGIYGKVYQGVLSTDAFSTANLITKMDCLFDALNTNSANLRRGKKLSPNLSNRSPHLSFFKEMISFIQDLEFVGAKQRPPSQDGWLQTMNGVDRLWRNLKNKYPNEVVSLATRRLQLGPLENLFGRVRSICASNANPTVSQFVTGFKTAIISSLTQTNSRTNCEEDQNNILTNLNHFLTQEKSEPLQDAHFTDVDS